MTDKPKGSRGLWLIAAFKLVKGLGLLILGIGVLKLLHTDVAAEVAQWIDILRVDPHNHYIQEALAKLGLIHPRKLKPFSVRTFFYSPLYLPHSLLLSLPNPLPAYDTTTSP